MRGLRLSGLSHTITDTLGQAVTNSLARLVWASPKLFARYYSYYYLCVTRIQG